MAVGDVTQGLLDELGLRLEDPSESSFTQTMKLKSLNNAQKRLCNMLNSGYLTELETVDSAEDVSGGNVSLSSLDNDVLRGAEGIIAVKFYAGGTGDGSYMNRQPVEKLRDLENSFLAASDDNLIYYVFNNTLYVQATTLTDSTADIYYRKVPTDMSVTSGAGVDPTVNSALYEVMLLLAEAECWAMDAQLERRGSALKSAYEEIEILNARYQEVKGIGTKSSRRLMMISLRWRSVMSTRQRSLSGVT